MEKMLNGLDLFSGIGGITIGLQEWIKPIAYCEIAPYCQSVLLQRMQEGDLPKAPIWDDIRTLSTKELPQIDIIYGGFPCQDISIAGKQKGLGGKRSGLFFEVLRLVDEETPSFIFLENVPNIRIKGAERVCKELAERGYDCRWCMLSDSDVGARHKRERWFLLANSETNETEHPEMKIKNNRRLAKNGNTHSINLADTVGSNKQTGQLNPIFVEWLMGYPIGWTELKPLETQ